ncbi:hypothetical protein EB796_002725 [Bugula neritina]|uniref:Uncharacterized protein n=1 Tax=Bugula neritina TaxID=10212 RepID=A0A7J7KLQ3_BUGNE|nr:hypothetical protein EB796_002725 [Bugula neritina]
MFPPMQINITSSPPNKLGRQMSPATFHTPSPHDTHSSSSYSSHQLRAYSSDSSPRSPTLTSSFNGNHSNTVNNQMTHSERTVQSAVAYDPPANRGMPPTPPTPLPTQHLPNR